ncbi:MULTISPECIES: hypothetical protein [Streptococcus]|uniref:hypothetical protein n=1 Tax=Streptococcus TaxID=1301 RepID=UPI0003F72193|nr:MULTISPECIES: hypothetical protein [Streptococcus]MBY0752382.1 hypothetical protein [Streptococcus sp. 2018037]MDY7593398.1 hypothetical protein [Streptococcus suis]MDY7594198.1 hypothetical protein [Streptococcus suis]NQQ27930.1 hypothetical protein [Streptococcus suis]WNF58957.1 hypothetical protein RJW50_06785 [Streptococcus suis]
MEVVKTVIGALGIAGTIRGLFAVWSGWEEFSIGRAEENPQRQSKGKDGMVYGAMMVAGAVSIATAIITTLNSFRF